MKTLVVLLVTLGLLASGCGDSKHASTVSPAGSTPTSTTALRNLDGIEQLRSLFNTNSKKPRLIVLVSPT